MKAIQRKVVVAAIKNMYQASLKFSGNLRHLNP